MSYNPIKAFIEIPALSTVKYEIEKKTGHIFVDRFLKTAMHYPCNYGSIPETLAGDGDELDVLVITSLPLKVATYIHCRPIGVLHMTDEKGEDDKIIALPIDYYHSIESVENLEKVDSDFLAKLRHFFEHYKDLDKGKWVKVQPGWGDRKTAERLIEESISAYHAK